MKKKTGASQDLDNLSMLNFGEEDEEMNLSGEGGGGTLDGISADDSQGTEDGTDVVPTDELKVDLNESEAKPQEEAAEPNPEQKTEDAGVNNANQEEDFEKIIDDLLASQEDLDNKAQEIADKASENGDSEMQQLVSEFQTMLAEKNSEISELKASNEIWQKKAMDKYNSDVDLSVYKGEIDTMDSNPKLRALVKFRNTSNEKTTNKITQILADLFYDRTGTDINELLNQTDKEAISSALNGAPSEGQFSPEQKPVAEPEITREESTSNILGF